MRSVPALAIAGVLSAAACGRDASSNDARTAVAASEPDPVVIRIPRAGGTARAALFTNLDSIVWRSAATPPINRVLGFDPDAGIVSFVTAGGLPARLDLRIGRTFTASREKLRSLSTVNGSDIFGIDRAGKVVRVTPTGEWRLAPPRPARSVFPQPDGSVIIAAGSGNETTLWRVVPPDERLTDTAFLPMVGRAVRTQAGDRVYFSTDTAVVGVRARDLQPLLSTRIRGRVVAMTPTPSGDRLYVSTTGSSTLLIVRRFGGSGSAGLELPGSATDLRMDPLGRYLLARASAGDSVWVVAIGTDRVIATLASEWRADLPTVAPDGSIATLSKRDVTFVDPESGRNDKTVSRGASDYWAFVMWNGFRPRAAGLDQPVSFSSAETSATAPADSPSVLAPPAPEATPADSGRVAQPQLAPAFTVSFAAVLSAERARALADSIAVGGEHPRVVATTRGSATLYRVVLGPYTTKAAAEDAGRAANRSFWVYEGAP